MVFGPHRSGTNFIQKVIELNFDVSTVLSGKNNQDSLWKHHMMSNRLAFDLNYRNINCIVCARDPIKWLNGVVNFNANMWKTAGVLSEGFNKKYSFYYPTFEEYKKSNFDWANWFMDVRLLVKHWNDWYFSWFYQTMFPNYLFIHYHDMLVPKKREKVFKLLESYGLERTSPEILVPGEVEHSKIWNDMKTKEELDISFTPHLKPEWLEFAFERFDTEIVAKIESSRIFTNGD